MKSKIHRATVTGADIHYEGSIGIDRCLMERADLLPGEKVDVYNITNGNRFSTYVIEEEARSGSIFLNGAAARMVSVGDEVIIVSYGLMDHDEAIAFQPRILLLNKQNKVVEAEPQ